MSTRRPILLLDPDNFTPHYVANLAQALVSAGWEVEWLTSPCQFEPIPAPPEIEPREIFFHQIKGSWSNRVPMLRDRWWLRRAAKALAYPWDLRSLHSELRSRQPGVLHIHWALIPQLDALYWARFKKEGWKLVFTAHDVEPRAGTNSRWTGSMKKVLPLADAVVVHSKVEQDVVLDFGIAEERIWVIPPGGPGYYYQPGPPKEEARRELGLPADSPVVLFFGLIKPYKGLDLLIEAMQGVRDRLPQADLVVAGGIPGRTGPWKRLIRQTAHQGGVIWHTGYVPQERVGLYFSAADLVALPYRTSSTSGVLAQVMAAGRPVVATNQGALAERVSTGQTGLLVPPGSRTDLTEALFDLLADPARRRQMGENARQVAAEQTWERSANLTGKVYEELVPGLQDASCRGDRGPGPQTRTTDFKS